MIPLFNQRTLEKEHEKLFRMTSAQFDELLGLVHNDIVKQVVAICFYQTSYPFYL